MTHREPRNVAANCGIYDCLVIKREQVAVLAGRTVSSFPPVADDAPAADSTHTVYMCLAFLHKATWRSGSRVSSVISTDNVPRLAFSTVAT